MMIETSAEIVTFLFSPWLFSGDSVVILKGSLLAFLVMLIFLAISSNLFRLLIKKEVITAKSNIHRYAKLVLMDIPAVCMVYFVTTMMIALSIYANNNVDDFFAQFGNILLPLLLLVIVIVKYIFIVYFVPAFLINKNIIIKEGMLMCVIWLFRG